jgi:hypothetical protein
VYSYEVRPGGSTSGTRQAMKRVESGSTRLGFGLGLGLGFGFGFGFG